MKRSLGVTHPSLVKWLLMPTLSLCMMKRSQVVDYRFHNSFYLACGNNLFGSLCGIFCLWCCTVKQYKSTLIQVMAWCHQVSNHNLESQANVDSEPCFPMQCTQWQIKAFGKWRSIDKWDICTCFFVELWFKNCKNIHPESWYNSACWCRYNIFGSYSVTTWGPSQ